MDLEEEKRRRRRRINRLKKMILIMVVAAILIPLVLCIVLGIRLHKALQYQVVLETNNDVLHKQIDDIQLEYDYLLAQREVEKPILFTEPDERDSKENVDDTIVDDTIAREEIRKVYLTFDDGPSIYTGEILDILKEYNVKATFFVVGREEEQFEPLYKRIVDEGHTLGMHSYSHKYNEIYASEDAFLCDIKKLQDFLEDKTGQKCVFARFPGGSSNTVSTVDMHVLISDLIEQGVTYFDWNISSGDAISGYVSANKIVSNCTESLSGYQTAVILLHDAAEKKTTVEALPKLIETIEAMDNTVLLPITEDTKLIQHIKNESEE